MESVNMTINLRMTVILLVLGMNWSCKVTLQKLANQDLPDSFPNVCIDDGSVPSAYQPCEPSIIVSPANPDFQIAGIVLDKIWYSSDRGRNWSLKVVKSSYGVFGDPVIAADASGNTYFAHLADPSGQGRSHADWLDRIVVQRSVDFGKTWNDGSYAGHRPPADQDKQWIAIDPRNESLYMTWTEFDQYGSNSSEHKSRILFSKSNDYATTWTTARVISQLEGNCLDSDLTPEGAVPAVGPEGQVYVAWSYDSHIYFDRSFDAGASWLAEDQVVCEQPGGWDIDIPGLGRANGMPVTATDLSHSPFRGHIYINYCDQSNGSDDTDVWLVKSTDQGKTWTNPLRVNDDQSGRHQFFTWMSIDPKTGAIYIVFYDRRQLAGNWTDVYLAYSFDGGSSFTNRKISESPFLPNTSVFFGDYNNISAYDGTIRPIWTRMEDNKTSIWTAIIDF